MKKIISCLIMVTLLISCFSCVAMAKQNNESINLKKIIDVTTDEKDVFGETAKAAEANVGIKTLYNYNINMPVTPYCQYSMPWADDLMLTKNYRIDQYGCALTCCTMIARYYGKNTDPAVFNVAMGNYACDLGWYQVPSYGGSGYISSVDTIKNYPTVYQVCSYARTALEQNKPVIFGFVKTNAEGKQYTHYVLIKAVYGQGTSISDFGCIDPKDGLYSNLYDTLGGRPIYRIVIYNR